MGTKTTNNSGSKQLRGLLGAHFSIAKGLHNAIFEASSLGCNVLQLFTKNANTWKERTILPGEVERFKQAKAETKIGQIASHTSYLINLAAVEEENRRMSCQALKREFFRSSMLGISYVVLHPGFHMGEGEREGIHRIVTSINEVISETPSITLRLLLETTAGQGSALGYTFDQLALIIDGIKNRNRIGICLDSCHIFAAGYDIRTPMCYHQTIAAFDAIIGLEHLFLIHLNDSKKDLGSRVDRHEHIGRGFIGIKSFECFINDRQLSHIPKIIETPKERNGKNWDHVNLKRLRMLLKPR
jgi:deoxyribonuclease-4